MILELKALERHTDTKRSMTRASNLHSPVDAQTASE